MPNDRSDTDEETIEVPERLFTILEDGGRCYGDRAKDVWFLPSRHRDGRWKPSKWMREKDFFSDERTIEDHCDYYGPGILHDCCLYDPVELLHQASKGDHCYEGELKGKSWGSYRRFGASRVRLTRSCEGWTLSNIILAICDIAERAIPLWKEHRPKEKDRLTKLLAIPREMAKMGTFDYGELHRAEVEASKIAKGEFYDSKPNGIAEEWSNFQYGHRSGRTIIAEIASRVASSIEHAVASAHCLDPDYGPVVTPRGTLVKRFGLSVHGPKVQDNALYAVSIHSSFNFSRASDVGNACEREMKWQRQRILQLLD